MRKRRAESASGVSREGERERTADDVSKGALDIETGSGSLARDEPGGYLSTAQVVSGMEAARVRSAAFTRNVGRRTPIPRARPAGRAGERERAERQEPQGAEYRRGVRWRTGS